MITKDVELVLLPNINYKRSPKLMGVYFRDQFFSTKFSMYVFVVLSYVTNSLDSPFPNGPSEKLLT